MFKHAIALAPMEDVSDVAFRLTCKKYGADLVYTEMLHAKSALVRNNLPILAQEEQPLGVQVAGNNVDEIIKTAKQVENKCQIIDINLGCPGRNVIASGYGSILLKQPDLIYEIIRQLKQHLTIPITAKMRAGFADVNAHEIARIIEAAGADAITIHGRTQRQGYSGKSDWQLIKDIKQQLRIPVIGNGDITCGKAAAHVLGLCDGIMIGRAAIGDPLIFKRIKHYLAHGEEIPSTPEEKIEAFQTYLDYATQYGLLKRNRILRQAQCFTRGLPGAAHLRDTISKQDTQTLITSTIEFIHTTRSMAQHHSLA